jgi:beta-lactam-binding protein with PASTA domain
LSCRTGPLRVGRVLTHLFTPLGGSPVGRDSCWFYSANQHVFFCIDKISPVKIRVRYQNNSGEVTAGAVRIFRISMTVLSMLAVALFSALITMRLAIHTGEVEVPSVAGLTVEEAAQKTNSAHLALTVENRFYSTTVPAGRVLSQSPLPGASVRKGWHMRITESLGPQRVTIPDTVGMNERDAGMALRRASLDLGAIAHLPSPGPADTVLAQTPPANAEGVDKPEVSLLLSEPEANAPHAWVMPNLVGLSFSMASTRMRDLDLHLYAIVPQVATDSDIPTMPITASPAGYVVTQVPAAGMRVSVADNPHVKMSAVAAASAAPAATSVAAPAGSSVPAAPAAKPAVPVAPAVPTAKPATQAAPAAPIVRQPPTQVR